MKKPFMSRLREAIMTFHQEAETKGPFRHILDKNVNLEDYNKVLNRLYGFVEPAESMIWTQLGNDFFQDDYSKRRRIVHLKKDLLFLGTAEHSIGNISLCSNMSIIDNPAAALGILYLFEGSRLGGLTLTRALREKFNFQGFSGCAYFGSNGLDVPDLWKSFKDEMEKYVEHGGDGDRIIDSASTGFRFLNKWMEGVCVEKC